MSCSCCTTLPLTTGSTWAMLAQVPLPTPSCLGSGTGWGHPGLPGPAANLPGCLRKAPQSSVSPSLKWWCPHPPQHSVTEQGETHMGESGASPHGGRLPGAAIPGAPRRLLLRPGAPVLRGQTGVMCRTRARSSSQHTHVHKHAHSTDTHAHTLTKAVEGTHILPLDFILIKG